MITGWIASSDDRTRRGARGFPLMRAVCSGGVCVSVYTETCGLN